MEVTALIAEFDPFLSQHIEKFGNSGKGTVNYLSSSTVNELIQMIAEAVMSIIVQELSRSKYYSISVDSTPDLSHTDQLAVTVRYVLDGVPTERFITFLPIKSHQAAELVDFLESQGIDIMNCRGQTYHNASNMVGKYSGMQARIKLICPSDKMDLLETAFLSTFWNKILNRFNATRKALQSATINLRDATDLLTSLESFLDSLRGEFDSFEIELVAHLAEANTKLSV